MLNKLRARMQDEKGFTLIELLVVILIIGILAAIALPAFLNQREKAQDVNAKADVRTAQTAMETYYTDNQAYTGAKSDATGADTKSLQYIEPALKNANVLTVTVNAANSYTLSIDLEGLQRRRLLDQQHRRHGHPHLHDREHGRLPGQPAPGNPQLLS